MVLRIFRPVALHTPHTSSATRALPNVFLDVPVLSMIRVSAEALVNAFGRIVG
jgi:hypothetical protein